MPDNGHVQTLQDAVIGAIEEMSFIALVACPDRSVTPELIGASRQSMLSVQRPARGEYSLFILTISPKLLREIAYNVLGLESEDAVTEESELDALAELLNTISGRFMREITPADETYELGLPLVGTYHLEYEPEKTNSCVFESETGEHFALSYIQNI